MIASKSTGLRVVSLEVEVPALISKSTVPDAVLTTEGVDAGMVVVIISFSPSTPGRTTLRTPSFKFSSSSSTVLNGILMILRSV